MDSKTFLEIILTFLNSLFISYFKRNRPIYFVIGRLRFSYVIVYNQSLLYHFQNLSRLEEKHETR